MEEPGLNLFGGAEPRRLTEDALQAASLAVSSARGDRIFQELTRFLATILHCELALVGQLVEGPPRRVRTLGVYGTDGYLENFEYELAITPCRDVVGKGFHAVADGVAARYPEDVWLARFGAAGYAGYPLNDPAGRPIGVLAILSKRPLSSPALIEAVLKIFAVRAEAELERRAQVEALRVSEEQYRAIFNATADSMVLRDADFRVVDVNPAYEAMSGNRREDVLGRDTLTMSRPELNDHVRALHRRALAGEAVMFDSKARRRNGERFHIETRGVPILRQGRPHVLYVGRDITARKLAERALRASEEQYRGIFNAVADALVLRDAEFRIVDVNAAYVAMSGYSREEVIGQARLVAGPPGEEGRFRALHARALAGEAILLESQRIRKDGQRVDVELRGVPIRHRDEPHVLYIGRDISERKRAEQVLSASEEQYRAIFNATTDALVLRDEDGVVVDVNPAMTALTGYSRDEVIGRARWIFARPERAGLASAMHRRVVGGESVHFEVEGVRKDGSPIEVEMRAVPMHYRGKAHALGMARDITARKRAEAEREALEAQLRQAQKMEAIGHLTGGIAHDFNNLLASIMGYVVLASEREGALADPKLTRHLEQALSSARRARDLVQQMLTFSRGRRGAPRAMDLGAAVAQSLTLVRGSLPSTLEISDDVHPGTPVMLDPVQLDQVLLNLCINARDAMAGIGALHVSVRPAGNVRAVCSSCRQVFEGDAVELAVADTGPGIAPAVRERMFEPFYTTKEVGRGSGMGLATVHGIVHEHRGHVVVETSAQGSRFRILLPRLDGGLPAPAAAATTGPGTRKAPLAGRVLVVDDEGTVAEFMRELLEGWGLAVTVMTSPQRALKAFSRNPAAWDVVITDQTMPEITGTSLAQELAARRPGLPVILYTGHVDPIARDDLEAAGIRALLHKPVEPDDLHAALAACLK